MSRTTAIFIHLAVLMSLSTRLPAQTMFPWHSMVPITVKEVNPGIEAADLNTAMFTGILLTRMQIDSIVTLSHVIAQARKDRLAQIPSHTSLPITHGWDSTTRASMVDFLTQERLAYRAILTPSQQVVYDRNTALIFHMWVERNKHRDAQRDTASQSPASSTTTQPVR